MSSTSVLEVDVYRTAPGGESPYLTEPYKSLYLKKQKGLDGLLFKDKEFSFEQLWSEASFVHCGYPIHAYVQFLPCPGYIITCFYQALIWGIVGRSHVLGATTTNLTNIVVMSCTQRLILSFLSGRDIR